MVICYVLHFRAEFRRGFKKDVHRMSKKSNL